jgi:hypothetical protein
VKTKRFILKGFGFRVWSFGFLKTVGHYEARQQRETQNPKPETVKVWVFYNGKMATFAATYLEEKYWMLLKKN